jgi:hypothetical protein
MDNVGISIVMKYLFYCVAAISAAYGVGKVLSLKFHKEKKDKDRE